MILCISSTKSEKNLNPPFKTHITAIFFTSLCSHDSTMCAAKRWSLKNAKFGRDKPVFDHSIWYENLVQIRSISLRNAKCIYWESFKIITQLSFLEKKEHLTCTGSESLMLISPAGLGKHINEHQTNKTNLCPSACNVTGHYKQNWDILFLNILLNKKHQKLN